MRISLVTMAGRCLASVVVDATDEKEDIVRHIPGLVGCPPELRLFHGSRELAPGESLEAVGVVDGSLLSVMMQARAPYVLVSSQQHGGAPHRHGTWTCGSRSRRWQEAPVRCSIVLTSPPMAVSW